MTGIRLSGQPVARVHGRMFLAPNQEAGYVLLGITILLVILGIFMAAAVPLWQNVMKREREEELIWRGRQYVLAIELYQRKYPGAFPANYEILVEQKFLRKLYKDPMTEDGEWKILRQLSPELRAVPGLPQGQRGAARGQSAETQGEASAPGGASGQRVGGRGFGGGFGGGSDQGLGGIVGVVSKSQEKSMRIWNGKDRYSDWLFVFGLEAQVPGRLGPGVPGAPPGAPGASPWGTSPFTPRPPGSSTPRPPSSAPRQT